MYLKRLNQAEPADVELAARLYCDDPSYSLQTFGRLPDLESASELVRTYPENCLPQHRLAYVAFNKTEPVALVRVLRGWPEPEISTIGLILVSTRVRRRHLGCEVVDHLSRQARNWSGIKRWRVVVLESNQAALRFWRHLGFETMLEGQSKPDLKSTLTVMERAIKQRPSCLRPGHKPVDSSAKNHAWLSARL